MPRLRRLSLDRPVAWSLTRLHSSLLERRQSKSRSGKVFQTAVRTHPSASATRRLRRHADSNAPASVQADVHSKHRLRRNWPRRRAVPTNNALSTSYAFGTPCGLHKQIQKYRRDVLKRGGIERIDLLLRPALAADQLCFL